MTQYIYMNHRLRQAQPGGPVIVVQDEPQTSDSAGRTREADEFVLYHRGERIGRVKFDPKMLAACATHEVKVWVELDDAVQIVDPKAKPIAPTVQLGTLKIKKV